MILRLCWLVFPVAALFLPATISAAPPWQSLIPFWRVDAETDKDFTLIVNRKEAIEFAINLARPGDMVLIAGKGHEDYQILKSQTIHFEDRKVAEFALRRRLGID